MLVYTGSPMALNNRNSEVEKVAEALAKLTGETKTEAVTQALRKCLARLRRERPQRRLADKLDEIAFHCSQLPVRDSRMPDEILGYDEHGLPRDLHVNAVSGDSAGPPSLDCTST